MAKYHFNRINNHGIKQQYNAYKFIEKELKRTGKSYVFDQDEYPSDDIEEQVVEKNIEERIPLPKETPEIVLAANLEIAIAALALMSEFNRVPSKIIELVIVPVSPVEINEPVVFGRVKDIVEELATGWIVITPVLVPFRTIVLPLAKFMFSLEVQAPVELTQLKVLFVVPFKVIPPPSAVMSVGEAVFPKVILMSLTSTVVALILVVLPLT